MVTESHARSNFAAQHLAAARYFQSMVKAIEDSATSHKDQFSPPPYLHCWYAAVVFAVMAMEANVYDILTASTRREQTPLAGTVVPAKLHRKPLLERYGFVWKAILGSTLDTVQGIGQAARALVLLRNEITHYKTEWRDVAVISSELEAMLRTRITLNPFKCGEIFFPEKCVSANSAEWAATTAHEFMSTFAAATGVPLNV